MGVLFAFMDVPMFDSLASYPRWLVVAGVTVAAAVGIWILAKMLKWMLWLLLIVVVAAGAATALWLVLH